MTRRRTHGSGSLTQRKDGIWIGRVYSGWTSQGTRRRLTVSSKDRSVAARKLRDLQRRLAQGDVPTADTTGRTTVKAWADTWLTIHAAKVRPSTYGTDAGTVNKWIIPTIGHRRLADLTPADVRALRKAITGAGRSSSTALHSHRTLMLMLKAATVEGHRVPQRVLLVDKPSPAANDRDAIPLAQLVKILAVVRSRPDSARWVAAILNGMRQGEVLGMTWARTSLDTEGAERMDVSWQLQWLTKGHTTPDGWEAEPVTGQFWWTKPKTAKGTRVIPLVPWLVTALQAEREAWTSNPWDLIWVGDDGRPIKAKDDREAWRAIQAAAGVRHPSGRPWHVHECRHAAITLLIRAGVPDHVIAKIVGQAALVKAYAHMDETDTRAGLNAVAGLLGLTPPAALPAPDPASNGSA